MITNIEQLEKSLLPHREKLVQHPLYTEINDLERFKIFISNHIYAVWDFMSLLKALQRRLTCVDLPWQPVGDPETRFLINEIVTGEESDIDENGDRCSHFELYLKAMQQLDVDTSAVQSFTTGFNLGQYEYYINGIDFLHPAIKKFLNFTFDICLNAPDHVLAAVFTFGREDIIPDMFIRIVKELHARFPDKVAVFSYYLERHIEVDGGEHSHLGKRMVANLCGQDTLKWQEATAYARLALDMRLELWDGIKDQL